MTLAPHTTPSGFLLPSIHSAPPFFTQQPNPSTQATLTEHWTKLILSYARYRRLFLLKVEDAEVAGNDWDEVFRNERINRRLMPDHLRDLIAEMVKQRVAVYDPPNQDRSILLYWRLVDEWAEALYDWVASTGQLNTIMTLYEIVEPPVSSPLSGIPLTILRRAINVLTKTSRAQIIAVSDGEGVRFLQGAPGR